MDAALRLEQQGLCTLHVAIASSVPRVLTALVRPKALEQWEWVGLVKPQSVPNVISIMSLVYFAKDALIRILKNVAVFSASSVPIPALDLRAYDIHNIHTSFESKSKNYHLRMLK